jgi:hypothetical protein
VLAELQAGWKAGWFQVGKKVRLSRAFFLPGVAMRQSPTQDAIVTRITLPDGSVRAFSQAPTVADVAASIGQGLAKAALAGRVNGELVDTSYRIESDANLAIITDKGSTP